MPFSCMEGEGCLLKEGGEVGKGAGSWEASALGDSIARGGEGADGTSESGDKLLVELVGRISCG